MIDFEPKRLLEVRSLFFEAIIVYWCLQLGLPFSLYSIFSISVFTMLFVVFLPFLIDEML